MAILNIVGFDAGDFSECLSSAGTVSVQSSTYRTGGYALQVNPTTTGTGTATIQTWASTTGATTNFTGSTDRYARFYFRYATKPSANNEEFFRVSGASTGHLFLRLNSSGNILAYADTTLLATGSTVLAVDTWYRIEVKRLAGTTGVAWEVKIDGTSEISGSSNFANDTGTSVVCGKPNNRNSQTVDFFYDDLSVSNSAYPGPGMSAICTVDGAGNYTQWTASTGTAYQCIDELPHNSDTDYVTSSTNTHMSTYSLTSSTSIGIASGSTINATRPTIVAKRGAVGAACSVVFRSNTTDDSWTSTSWGSAYATYSKVKETDPATSSAWTTSGVDGCEIGAAQQSNTAARVTSGYMVVDWNPPDGQPTSKRLGGVRYATRVYGTDAIIMW